MRTRIHGRLGVSAASHLRLWALLVVALGASLGGSAMRADALAGAPFILTLSPSSGPASGGTTVTISGAGFTGATQVMFGSTIAGFVFVNDSQIIATSPPGAGAAVNVAVTGPGGASPGVPFTYTSGPGVIPVVLALDPGLGPISGGNLVNLFGSGFLGATKVHFDEVSTSFSVISDSQIVALAPHAVQPTIAGVTVTTPAGSSAPVAYRYGIAAVVPSVTSVAPSSGPVTGGDTVALTGVGFTGATEVVFGSNATQFTVVNDTRIVVRVPAAQSAGVVPVRVTGPLGTSVQTAAATYTYLGGATVVSSVTPASGSTAGGTQVTITGSGFTGVTTVSFGGVPAAFTAVGDTQIIATAPPHAAGQVNVTVTSPAGSGAGLFSYVATGPGLCPAIPLWVDDPAYGSSAGGFYYDPVSGSVWTAERSWHLFSPVPARPNPTPLWVDALTYGGVGGGFYWDPVSGQVWTGERGWHQYSPQGCVAR